MKPNEIIERLRVIRKKLESVVHFMSATQADLDAALTAIGDTVSQIIAEVVALIAKIQATVPAADFTAEVSSIQALQTSLQDAADKAKAVTGQ